VDPAVGNYGASHWLLGVPMTYDVDKAQPTRPYDSTSSMDHHVCHPLVLILSSHSHLHYRLRPSLRPLTDDKVANYLPRYVPPLLARFARPLPTPSSIAALTPVLDASAGKPAAGVFVELSCADAERVQPLAVG